MKFQPLVQSFFKVFGLKVVRHRESWEDSFKAELIRSGKIEALVDVGAFKGFYANSWRNRGFKGSMYSIEPTKDSFEKLLANSPNDSDWQKFKYAISDAPGELEMFISTNGQSSSLLKLADNFDNLVPETKLVGKEVVQIKTLDEIISPVLAPDKRTYIKVDVQGLEIQVLRGATKVLEQTHWLEIEICVENSYDSAPSADELITELSKLGFEMLAVFNPFYGRQDDRILQFDAVFSRKTGR